MREKNQTCLDVLERGREVVAVPGRFTGSKPEISTSRY